MNRDYIYAMFYDADTGAHIHHYRSLGIIYKEGDIIEKTVKEGYIPRHIIRVENTKWGDGACYQKLFIRDGEFVKTYCDHEWNVTNNIQLAVGSPGFDRTCIKCQLKESFNYGKAKWE
jgi:hypothetical protein